MGGPSVYEPGDRVGVEGDNGLGEGRSESAGVIKPGNECEQ